MPIPVDQPLPQKLMRRWLWAGINPKSLDYFCPTRITNVVSLIVIVALIAQLPMAVYFYELGGTHKILLICGHLIALCLVPWFNQRQQSLLASAWLCSVYASYIIISCLSWQINLQVQYFLILGCAMLPFLFSAHTGVWISLFCFGYCAFFLWLQQVLPTAQQTALNAYQAKVLGSNAVSLVLATLLCSWHIKRNQHQSWQKISNEHQRSEQLLKNMLPEPIAEQLKDSHSLVADYFEQASVLFADMSGFSQIVHHRSPQELVSLLNDLFSTFDDLCQQHGLQKIKTNGDQYMAVAGLPKKDHCHAVQSCRCALAMQQAYAGICQQYRLTSALRIGIASGEVIAGVIGKKQFSYDIWGDTVNLAARMESQGRSNQIQVTESTATLCKHVFQFESRGEVEVKGMGTYQTYWLVKETHATSKHIRTATLS